MSVVRSMVIEVSTGAGTWVASLGQQVCEWNLCGGQLREGTRPWATWGLGHFRRLETTSGLGIWQQLKAWYCPRRALLCFTQFSAAQRPLWSGPALG